MELKGRGYRNWDGQIEGRKQKTEGDLSLVALIYILNAQFLMHINSAGGPIALTSLKLCKFVAGTLALQILSDRRYNLLDNLALSECKCLRDY